MHTFTITEQAEAQQTDESDNKASILPVSSGDTTLDAIIGLVFITIVAGLVAGLMFVMRRPKTSAIRPRSIVTELFDMDDEQIDFDDLDDMFPDGLML